MRRGELDSWQIRTSDRGQHLTTMLYVRDAAGLAAPADFVLPPLAPRVEMQAALAPYATAAAAEQWDRWWESYLAERAGPASEEFSGVFVAPPEPGTDLRTLYEHAADEAREWSRAREAEFRDRQLRLRRQFLTDPGATVRRIERELGRTSAPFTLCVLLLPLERRWGRRISSGLVVVSELLWNDAGALDLFLEPVVRALV